MPSYFLSRTLRHKYEDRPGDKDGGMQAVQRIEREKSMDGGKEKEEEDDPHTSAAKQKRPLRIGAELLPAERPSCSCIAACI